MKKDQNNHLVPPGPLFSWLAKENLKFGHNYKARHAHNVYTRFWPKYSKIQVLPGITSCRLVKDNKQAIELNSLLINNMPEG